MSEKKETVFYLVNNALLKALKVRLRNELVALFFIALMPFFISDSIEKFLENESGFFLFLSVLGFINIGLGVWLYLMYRKRRKSLEQHIKTTFMTLEYTELYGPPPKEHVVRSVIKYF